MKKLYLIQCDERGDTFTNYAATKEEADRIAIKMLDYMTDLGKATCCVYVMVYEVPDSFDPNPGGHDDDEYDEFLGSDKYLVDSYEVFRGRRYKNA